MVKRQASNARLGAHRTQRQGTDHQESGRSVVYGISVGTSALSLLKGQLGWLRSMGWEVTLVTSPDDAGFEAAQREEVSFHPIRMSRDISPFADMAALVRWIFFLWRAQPSAVNVSTPKAALLGGIAAWLTRVPRRVYVVRGLRLEGSHGVLAGLLWLAEWLTMHFATDVLFVSRSLAEEAKRRRLLEPGKSWVIGAGSSNGVDSRAIADRAAAVSRDEARSRLSLSPESFVVGFIGRITADKGIDTLVEAFSSGGVRDHIRLLVIGATEDPTLEAKLHSLGEQVRLVPWTHDVYGHLAAIDVLCLPTRREGFPNVVLEAAAAGVPSITTRATGAIDSVVDSETGLLIDIGAAQSLAEKINLLAGCPSLVQRMGQSARQRVTKDFQPERIWQGISEILAGATRPTYAEQLNRDIRIGSSQ